MFFWLLRERRDAVLLVKPDTILSWHLQGFRLFWRWKSSRPKVGKQRVPDNVIALIRQMADQNPLWGAEPECKGPACWSFAQR